MVIELPVKLNADKLWHALSFYVWWWVSLAISCATGPMQRPISWSVYGLFSTEYDTSM